MSIYKLISLVIQKNDLNSSTKQPALQYGLNKSKSEKTGFDKKSGCREVMKEGCYVVEITQAEYYEPKKESEEEEKESKEPECEKEQDVSDKPSKRKGIALEFAVLEQLGEGNPEVKYRFKGKKLFSSLDLHPKRIWLLKNLCAALRIPGNRKPQDLPKLMTGKKIIAKVVPQYNSSLDLYFHNITKFKSSPK